MSELDHVLVPELQVPTVWDLGAIEYSAVGTLQVNKIWFDFANLVAIFIALLSVTKLDHGVLLAETGMVRRQINDGGLSTHEPTATKAQLDCVHNVRSLEDEQFPLISR